MSKRRVDFVASLTLVSSLLLTASGCSTELLAMFGLADPVVDAHAFKFDVLSREYVLNSTRVPEADVMRDLSGQLCSRCHQSQTEDVMQSAHYTWSGRNQNVFFPGGGSHGMLDRACGLPATTALINYTNDVQLDECAKCHVGRFLPVMEGAFASSFAQMNVPNPDQQAHNIVAAGVDCLICHAETYRSYPEDVSGQLAGYAPADGASPTASGYARVARDDTDFDGDGAPDALLDMDGDGVADTPLMMDRDGDGMPETPWPTVAQDRSFASVSTVGLTTDDTCLRCHEHARTGYKRGTLFRPGHDVHAGSSKLAELAGAEGRTCVACHTATHHRFKRGDTVGGDLMVSDYDVGSTENQLSCVSCHPTDSLPSDNLHMSRHLAAMACETCHIPYASGITYSMYGHGGQIAFGRNADGYDTKVITEDTMLTGQNDDSDVDNDWEAYKVYPTLTWFDGRVSFLAQSLAVRGTPGAKITPFKPMANGMVFDARFFDGVMTGNSAMNGAYQYNAHSMYRFFAEKNNAEVFAALDMLDMTPDEVRNITLNDFFSTDQNRQAMALMQIFPNLVYFDKSTYGYEHYLIGSNQPWDANGDGIIDANQPFFFDMLAASNAGLRSFQGFNGPMGMPADYEWYPPFDDASQTITMKVPDGTLIKMFLGMQGMNLPAEQQPAFYQAIANYPAYSNGVTLGGHGVRPKEQALGYGNSCRTCHAEGGMMTHPVPVTSTVIRDVPGMGPLEMPVYRWRYYKMHGLVDLGLATTNEDIVNGTANVDVRDNTAYVRISDTDIVVNYLNPAGENSYRRADSTEALSGTSLTAAELTWSGGAWMPVLEPQVRMTPTYEVLGYTRDEILILE
ncbi:MAG: hypothetical protein H6819_05270 [Phycisphaerales bacterium]|nr:hypothetical protein [Phycisphaerales bacterium]MCB9854809.1 hypothetical protein [Phycisphaerales bacterium]MCB9863719.1 hypothetical protein [Phycisphaerales bacterium]